MKVATIFLILIFQVVDVLTTAYAMRKGHKEMNPLVAYLMRTQGEAFAYTAKLGLAALMIVYAIHHKGDLKTLATVSSVPIVNNLLVIAEDIERGMNKNGS